MDNEERRYRFALSRIEGIGPQRFKDIIIRFGSAKVFWEVTGGEINSIFGENIGTKINHKRDVIDINYEEERLKFFGIEYVVYGEELYPTLLSEISDPPVCLYYKGNASFEILNSAITIVGTRMNTKYGEGVLKEMIPELVKRGICIISGMAFGIDKLAHDICLKNSGKTAAVLASSLNNPTPRSNIQLFDRIIENGIVFSEAHPDDEVAAGNFPRRNRILAGLSKSTLVIEASEKSGALITAHLAFDYNRLVFAIPGSINQVQSKGCNNLIKIQRAQLVEKAEDILTELGFVSTSKNNKKNDNYKLSGIESLIFKTLTHEGPISLDQLKSITDYEVSDILVGLLGLEMNGFIVKNEREEYQVLL